MTELTLPESQRTPAATLWKYQFEGPDGRVLLADLFGDRARLAVYHPMPDFSGPEDLVPTAEVAAALAEEDLRLVLVSHAPYPKLEQYRHHFGRNLPAYSVVSAGFAEDFAATHRIPSAERTGPWDDDCAGLSFFRRERDSVRHVGSIAVPQLDFLGLLAVPGPVPFARRAEQ
ncbi:MAG: hypothetical protein QOI78_3425 [Actinomycetota bacterium]|nr:hypothetical protein [Actinomycetota bacterium]